MADNTASDRSASSAPDAATASRISKLFDIRLIIGGLLSVYGVILLIQGIADGAGHGKKSGSLHLNLWTGIAMLALGLLMLLWMRLNPLKPLAPADLAEEKGPRTSKAE